MVIIKKDVIFEPTTQLATDIYYPNETTSATKILIFWHGGGWFRGDKQGVKILGIDLANAGFMTFVPNYRLAPQAVYPAAHHDATTFIKWLLASDYTDTDDIHNIVQIGASVGGTMAIYLAGQYGFPTVTWSAPVSFASWIKEHPEVKPTPSGAAAGLTTRQAIADAFYKYFTLTYAGSTDANTLSALDVSSYQLDKLGPLFMLNSLAELTPLPSVLTLINELAQNGHPAQLLTIKGHGHAMDYGADYLDESIDFLHQIIKRQA
ncbi:MAG: alpha/beta hydrolase [Lactobacillus sp.]|nr:alpha/beta hydrolase [Lactobacillus sp.]MDN6052848.1 alpha/beta hydrolase [Lactobacillus sp.]